MKTPHHSQDSQDSQEETLRFHLFMEKVEKEFLGHPIVVRNRFTQWFSQAEVSLQEVRHFTAQFSVFSNFFLIAQLKKMINADSLENMRSAKEILANEIGVVFKGNSKGGKEEGEDAMLVETQGSVDGGTFRFRAAHFEWLLNFGQHLGLGFNDLGKMRHATPSTRFFCEQLDRYYASEDQSEASGASFAIENWAAAGFWEELISGLDRFKKNQLPELPLGFFLWHNQLESQHADHTLDELKANFRRPNFDEEAFLRSGRMMLDALAEFWNGLERDRVCGLDIKQRQCG